MPGNHPGRTASHQEDTESPRQDGKDTDASLHARMSEANVKIGPTET